MRKKIIFLAIISSLLIACSKDGNTEQQTPKTENIEQQNTTAVESNTNKVEDEANIKKSIAEVSDFSDFQNKILEKYPDLQITSFEVSKYSKGMELLFMTTDENFSKEKFIEISKFALEELRKTYEVDESIKIPATISYQKDEKTNAVFLYEYKE